MNNSKVLVTRVGNKSKVLFAPSSNISCLLCNQIPFYVEKNSIYGFKWFIKGKVCSDCTEQFNNDYKKVGVKLSIAEYIETIELANELIK